MASRVVAWIWVLGTVTVVGACGKAEGGSGPIPRSELPTRIASLLCDSLASCCKGGGFSFDTPACKTAHTTNFEREFAEDDARRVSYDAQAAADCLAAVSPNIQCGKVEEDDAPACERIFVGNVAQGQPCNSSRECAPVSGSSVSCDSADGVSPMVCTAFSYGSPVAHGKAGDACITTCYDSDDCGGVVTAPVPSPGPGGVPAPQPDPDPVACYRDEGLFCGAGICAPLLAPGEPCNAYEACQDTAFCDFNTGLCTSPQPDGTPCTSNNECQSDNCAQVPGTVTDPGFAPPQVCSSATAVTAEECANAFMDPPPDDTASPGDPGPAPGMP